MIVIGRQVTEKKDTDPCRQQNTRKHLLVYVRGYQLRSKAIALTLLKNQRVVDCLIERTAANKLHLIRNGFDPLAL